MIGKKLPVLRISLLVSMMALAIWAQAKPVPPPPNVWNYEDLTTYSASPANSPAFPSLQSSNGHAHRFFTEKSGSLWTIKQLEFDGQQSVIRVIDSRTTAIVGAGASRPFISAATQTADGRIHLIYQFNISSSSAELKHSVFDGNVWSPPVLLATLPIPFLTPVLSGADSVQATPDSHLHFYVDGYRDGCGGTNCSLTYFEYNGTLWSNEVIDTVNVSGLDAGCTSLTGKSFSRSPDGNLHILYQISKGSPTFSGEVRHAERGPGGWSTSQVDTWSNSSTACGSWSRFTTFFSPDGQFHLLYVRTSSVLPNYFRHIDSVSWSPDTLETLNQSESVGAIGTQVAQAQTPDGHTHVFYAFGHPVNTHAESSVREVDQGGPSIMTRAITPADLYQVSGSRLIVAANGHMHFVWSYTYFSGGPFFVDDGEFNGTSWTTTHLTQYDAGFAGPSLGPLFQSSDGLVHAFSNGADASAANGRAARRSDGPGVWTTTTIDSTIGFSGSYGPTFHASNDDWHVFFAANLLQGVPCSANAGSKHFRYTNGSWSVLSIAFNPVGFAGNSVFETGDSHLHEFNLNCNLSTLSHNEFDGSAWSSEVLATNPNPTGVNPGGMVIGPMMVNGRFSIVYRWMDSSNGQWYLKHVYNAVIDTTPPQTTATPSPGANAAGWNKTNVTVTLNATDDAGGSGVHDIQWSLSGAQSGSGSGGPVLISAEGTTTLSYFATDNASNVEMTKMLTVKIDKTAPTVTFGAASPAPNVNNWNNTNVSVPFTLSDGVSGLAMGNPTSPLVISTEGSAVTGTVMATDIAGNVATVSSSSFKIDKTPPTVSIVSPAATSYQINQNVLANFSCSDPGSGIASCIGSAANSSPVDTASAGAKVFGVTATDIAGNTSNASVNYTVTGKSLASLGPASLWIGLINSDDQGTRFDVLTSVYKNSVLVASGLNRCIDGVTRNANSALNALVPLGSLTSAVYNTGDVLSFKVETRIGTNADDTKCAGHNSAAGLRLYYDGTTRQAGFEAQLTPDPLKTFYLHTAGSSDLLNDVAPTAATAKTKDSSSINFSGGNLWKAIGTWGLTIP